MADPPATPALPSREILLLIVEGLLEDLAAGRTPERRPRKEELLALLAGGSQRLNLHLLRRLDRDRLTAFRREDSFRQGLLGALRELVISLHQPLLMPPRVRQLLPQVSQHTLAELRRDPELWAARALALLPFEIPGHLPLADLRLLLEVLRAAAERQAPQARSLAELDALYLYLERELMATPALELFLRRALVLAEQPGDPGELAAFYRLLGMRLPRTLARLEQSKEKDRVLLALKEVAGSMEPKGVELWARKTVMKKADELMKRSARFEELFELRFFFSQIGERSDRGLLSRKTGELARTADMRAMGYELLSRLKPGELDEDGLLELVPAVLARSELMVLEAPRRHLDRLIGFYLDTACPFLRSLKDKPEKVPRLIQNFKRQVGLLNLYRDLPHLCETMQRKLVLAICGPRMLRESPELILSWLTRLPPEFYPAAVMKTLRAMIRAKGPGYRFTAGDVLVLIAAYPSAEED